MIIIMRQNCRDAIITLIKHIKGLEPNSKCSEAMLIVDQVTSSLLSSVLYYFTGLGVKNMTKINLIKKPEPHCIGIYYLSPKSLSLIGNDFKDQPIYHSINVLLCEETDSEVLKTIANNSKVMERLAFFGQLKLNVKYLDNNVGIICPQAQIFKSLLKNQQKFPSEFASLLFESIVAGFGQRFILKVYHQNSPHILQIVKYLKGRYGSHQQYLQNNPKDILAQKEQRTVRLLLVDRKIDLISPIVRNFYYLTMLSDAYNIDYQNKKIPSKQGKEFDLSFDDAIFCEYKNLHISKAQNNIQPDFLKFKKDNKAAQLSSTNTTQNMEIKHIIRDIPEYNKKVQSYNSHITIMYEMSQMSRQQKIPQSGEIEQMIVTGMIGQDELKDKRIFQKAMELSANIKNQDNLVRIWLLLVLCNEMSESDKKTIIGRIKEVPKCYNLALALQSKLSHLMPKPTKLKPQFKKDKMFLDMHECLLAAIVSEITERGHSKLVSLTVIGEPEKQEASKFQRLQRRQIKEWLVCVLGGLSINQICQLQRLQSIYQGTKINLISDRVTNAWSFISSLGDAFL